MHAQHPAVRAVDGSARRGVRGPARPVLKVKAMRYGRRFTLPIDPWPRASLGERLSVTFVLGFLLLVPFIAAGICLILSVALVLHAYRSFDFGAALRAAIDRRRLGARVAMSGPRPEIGA